MKRTGLFVGGIALLSAALISACQTYDFERVLPLAVGQTTVKSVIASRRLKPNIMLLVDKSGSMQEPIDRTDPACRNGATICGPSSPCGPNCRTRISELKKSMADFFVASPSIARFGLTTYPNSDSGDSCRAATGIDVQLADPTLNDDGTDPALLVQSNAVNARIQAILPGGGTPTAASLAFVGSQPGLNDQNDFRDDFVLLMTDGLPNCNGQNVNNMCGCVSSSCTTEQINACACVQPTGCASAALCSIGCLDLDASVQAVRTLRQQSIRTIVVGFGAELNTGAGAAVLGAMAKEGGFARECRGGTDAECGSGNTCDPQTKLCSVPYFQAENSEELTAALRRIADIIPTDPCVFTLTETPSDPRYLSVVIDGQNVPPAADTYSFDAATNAVTFKGNLCTRITNSTNQAPVNMEFRIVQRL